MPLIFLAVLAVYQILLLLIHAVVYETVAYSFGWHWPWLAWVLGLLSFSFVIGSLLTYRFCNRFVEWFYRLSAYWFGLVLFLFVGCFGAYISGAFLYYYNWYLSPAVVSGFWLLLVIAVHTYATWQTQRPKITRITMPHSEHHGSWPDFWRGKKIVFVSDIHIGAVWGRKFAEKVAAKIRAETPEAILIGGDAFDGVRCSSEAFTEAFSKLSAPQGVYFASGNHEYIGDNQEFFFAAIRKAGVRILHNEVADLRDIQLVGIDWKDTHKAPDAQRILEGLHIDRARPSILIKHEPNDLSVSEQAGIGLQLSGHTHQGQIFPLNLITKRIYRGFDFGFKKLNEMMVYTSSGVGTWGPALRFGTKSEILVITFAS